MTPAVPETAMAVPAGDAPRALLILTGVVVAVPVKVIVTTATTPSANVVWLTPAATHVYPAAIARARDGLARSVRGCARRQR